MFTNETNNQRSATLGEQQVLNDGSMAAIQEVRCIHDVFTFNSQLYVSNDFGHLIRSSQFDYFLYNN